MVCHAFVVGGEGLAGDLDDLLAGGGLTGRVEAGQDLAAGVAGQVAVGSGPIQVFSSVQRLRYSSPRSVSATQSLRSNSSGISKIKRFDVINPIVRRRRSSA